MMPRVRAQCNQDQIQSVKRIKAQRVTRAHSLVGISSQGTQPGHAPPYHQTLAPFKKGSHTSQLAP